MRPWPVIRCLESSLIRLGRYRVPTSVIAVNSLLSVCYFIRIARGGNNLTEFILAMILPAGLLWLMQ